MSVWTSDERGLALGGAEATLSIQSMLSQHLLSRPVPCHVEEGEQVLWHRWGARDWNIGRAKRAASAVRVAQSRRNPREDWHGSQFMPIADAGTRLSGHKSVVLFGFLAFRDAHATCNRGEISSRWDERDGEVWSIDAQVRHPHPPNKPNRPRDMTRHGISRYRYLVSSGGALPSLP